MSQKNLIYEVIDKINQCKTIPELVDMAIEGCAVNRIEFKPLKEQIEIRFGKRRELRDDYYDKETVKKDMTKLLPKMLYYIGDPFGIYLLQIHIAFFARLKELTEALEKFVETNIYENIKKFDELISTLRFEKEYYERFNFFSFSDIKEILIVQPGSYTLKLGVAEILKTETVRDALFKDARVKGQFFSTLVLRIQRINMLLNHQIRDHEFKWGFKDKLQGKFLLYELYFAFINDENIFEAEKPEIFRNHLFKLFNLSDTEPNGEGYYRDKILQRTKEIAKNIKILEVSLSNWYKKYSQKKS